MLVLALVWWAWSAFVWAANAQDTDAPVLRLVLLLAMVLASSPVSPLPHAYGDDAPVFAVAYAGVRFLHLALYADASRRGNASWAAIAGFAITVVIGMALLVAGAIAGGTAQIVLWTAAAAIDYAGPAWLTRERLRGLQHVAVAHFAERYSLFIIICLGESIVAIGVGASEEALDAQARRRRDARAADHGRAVVDVLRPLRDDRRGAAAHAPRPGARGGRRLQLPAPRPRRRDHHLRRRRQARRPRRRRAPRATRSASRSAAASRCTSSATSRSGCGWSAPSAWRSSSRPPRCSPCTRSAPTCRRGRSRAPSRSSSARCARSRPCRHGGRSRARAPVDALSSPGT